VGDDTTQKGVQGRAQTQGRGMRTMGEREPELLEAIKQSRSHSHLSIKKEMMDPHSQYDLIRTIVTTLCGLYEIPPKRTEMGGGGDMLVSRTARHLTVRHIRVPI